MSRFLAVSPETVQEADAIASGKLVVPPTAWHNRKTPEHARWTERIRVTELSADETDSKAGHKQVLITVAGEVLAEGGSGCNTGRRVQSSGLRRLNWTAFNAGDRNDNQYKMHRETVAFVSELMRAGGFDTTAGISTDLWETIFADALSGEISPLMGAELTVEIEQKPRNDDPTRVEVSIRHILPPDNIGPATTLVGANSEVTRV